MISAAQVTVTIPSRVTSRSVGMPVLHVSASSVPECRRSLSRVRIHSRRRQLSEVRVPEIRVEHVSELTGSQVDHVREIYQQAFAPQLQLPFAELTATGPAD